MNYLTPHTAEWFAALESCNAAQAAAAKQIIKLAGRTDVCSVCGDEPATDYKVVGMQFTPSTGATTRLCDDCREVRRTMYVESFIRF